jgi:ribosomal protein S18 acetylase RimI-like enzyme
MDAPLATLSVRLPVAIRLCREDDLPALEWFGLFAAHHGLIRRLFAQHEAGEALMLVAEVNGAASGQLWIDLQRRRGERAAEIWAVRVLPCLQGQGIGARMMRAAEDQLRARGFHWALLGVETDNPDACRFYERLGYTLAGTTLPTHPPELAERAAAPQWVLRKDLRRADAAPPESTP